MIKIFVDKKIISLADNNFNQIYYEERKAYETKLQEHYLKVYVPNIGEAYVKFDSKQTVEKVIELIWKAIEVGKETIKITVGTEVKAE